MKLLRLVKDELVNDIRLWVQDGIITKSQAQKICSRYGIDYDKSGEKNSSYSILITLAYLFAGLALITILSANWENIPRALRMGTLIAVTLAINLTAFYYCGKKEETSIRLFFLGALSYGSSIMLIAQIYHLGEHFPDGIYWWALPTVALAFLLQNNALTFLAAALGLTWFFTESSMGFYPGSFFVFVSLLWWAVFYHKQNIFIFLLSVLGTIIWLEYSLAWQTGNFYEFHPGIENFFFTCNVFIFLYGVSHFMMADKNSRMVDYGTVLNLWIIRLLLVTGFLLSFSDPWKELITLKWEQPFEIMVLSAALCSTSIFLTYRARHNIIPVSIFSILILIMGISFYITKDVRYQTTYQVIDNVVLFFLCLWFIKKGISESLSQYFFMGIGSILLLAFLRYMDLIGDYIGAAILFLFFALILLGAAKYWEKSHQELAQ